MVICPQCAKLVDDTSNTSCPHCFTQLAAPAPQPGAAPVGQPTSGQPYPVQPPAPQQYAPQLSRSGGTRVSLTGEVIEDHGQAGSSPSFVGGAAAPRPPIGVSSRPVGLAKPKAAYGSRTEAPAKSGSPIVPILLGLVLLGGVGAGGWWFLMPHSNPKTVVQKFDTAIAAQDWKTLYTLIEMPSEDKAKYPSADEFATTMSDQVSKIRSNPIGGTFVDAFLKAYQTAQTGDATITGDTATVPVTLTVSLAAMGKTSDQTSTQQIPLKKVNGVWKIDGIQGALSGAGALGK